MKKYILVSTKISFPFHEILGSAGKWGWGPCDGTRLDGSVLKKNPLTQFLAKLTTSLAKPRGVRVLRRHDVSRLLSSTPATRIPGCGEGSVSAGQFASWGVKSLLDLRRVGAAELRARLGEQLGAKVYDRCRGMDNEPVQPDPAPSRVSSVVSFVPLIKPALCLGKPGEKMTPVFPWEVERLRSYLETLVDDLIDRMEEELEERGRRPTKLCVEHHLHRRGSKSQTFALPPPPTSTQGFPPEKAVVADLIGLPPPASLVELALTPFKSYVECSRNESRVIGGGGARGRGPGSRREAGGTSYPANETPPVVKLNLSFLGFENVVGSGVPGQRKLTEMMRRPANCVSNHRRDLGGVVTIREGGRDESKAVDRDRNCMSLDGFEERGKGDADVGPPPSNALPLPQTSFAQAQAHAAATTSIGSSTVRQPGRGGYDGQPSPIALGGKDGSVLVRCPRCKACLPLGAAWDGHRDEHKHVSSSEGRKEKRDALCLSMSPRTTPRGRKRTASLSSPEPVGSRGIAPPAAKRSCGREEVRAGGGSGGVVLESSAAVVASDDRFSWGAGGRERLSDLLRLAVTPAQAARVLTERGMLPADGRTRFAGVFLEASQRKRQSPSFSACSGD